MYVNKENISISASEIQNIIQGKLFGNSNKKVSSLS